MRYRHALTQWGVVLAFLVFLTSPALAASERYYLSLGTSLAVGVQPDAADKDQLTDEGYADQLHRLLRLKKPRLELVKLGCPAETTVTMIFGGKCVHYPAGSQLNQAVEFLRENRGAVSLVTIDMGANDLLPCVAGGHIEPACITAAFMQVDVNLRIILNTLRTAAGRSVPIVAMNYYNPFVAAWLQGPAGEALARASADVVGKFNTLLGEAYADFRVPVGEVERAFQADDFDIVPGIGLPINVVLVCQWTWMCAPPPRTPNIHANRVGYFVIALVLAGKVHEAD